MGVVNLFQLFENRNETAIDKLHEKTLAIEITTTIFKASKAHPECTIEYQTLIFNQIFNLKMACKDIIVVFDGNFIPPKKRNTDSPQKKGNRQMDPAVERMLSGQHHRECGKKHFRYGCQKSYEEKRKIPGIDYTLKILDILNIKYLFNCSDGEVACSHLNRYGIVDVVCSEDADNLFLGAKHIMRMYQTLKTGGRYADRKFSYECVSPDTEKNEISSIFLVWVFIQGGDFHYGIGDVGFKTMSKLLKINRFVEIAKKLENLNPNDSFDTKYSHWVKELKAFFNDYANNKVSYDRSNKEEAQAHAALLRVSKNIVKSNKFPDANEAIKYIFPLAVDVQALNIRFDDMVNESTLYKNREDMTFFLQIFTKDVLLSLGVVREMKKQIAEKSPEEWSKLFKIVKEYAAEDNVPAGYQIRYKNFFIPNLIEEDLRLQPEHSRGRTLLPPLEGSEMYPSLRDAARTRSRRGDGGSKLTTDNTKRESAASRLKREYPYSITLTKDRVWDELWDLVEYWDMMNYLESEIERSSPKKKRKIDIYDSPQKVIRNHSLLDMSKSPVKLKRKQNHNNEIIHLQLDLDSTGDDIKTEAGTDVIDLTNQSDSLILVNDESKIEEIVLSSD